MPYYPFSKDRQSHGYFSMSLFSVPLLINYDYVISHSMLSIHLFLLVFTTRITHVYVYDWFDTKVILFPLFYYSIESIKGRVESNKSLT